MAEQYINDHPMKVSIVEGGGGSGGSSISQGVTESDEEVSILVDDEGRQIVNQGDLNSEYDSVTSVSKSYTIDNLSISSTGYLLPATDWGSFAVAEVQLSGTYDAWVQFEYSVDGVTWAALYTAQGATVWTVPKVGKLFRVNCYLYTSGTINATVYLSSQTSDTTVAKINTPAPTFLSSTGMRDGTNNIVPMYSLTGAGDNVTGNRALAIGAMGFDGANIVRLRSGGLQKSATATASGNTAIATPTTGKTYRWMGYDIEVTGNATLASAGVLTLKLYDGTGVDSGFRHDIYLPATVPTNPLGQVFSKHIDLGHTGSGLGWKSGAVNRAPQINLSAALATGLVKATIWVIEE